MKTKVSITDDHALVREGIKLLLNSSGRYDVIIEASHGAELLQKLEAAKELPELAIVDVSMPVMDGYTTVAEVGRLYPDIACIALSLHDDYNTVFRMIDSGAKAYLLKDCEPDFMLETIDTVKKNGKCYSSFVVDKVMEYQKVEQEKSKAKIALPVELSPREIEFINKCCTELSYKEIASEMNVSPRTIDGYREALFEKTGARSRVGLVLFALENGLYKPAKRKPK